VTHVFKRVHQSLKTWTDPLRAVPLPTPFTVAVAMMMQRRRRDFLLVDGMILVASILSLLIAVVNCEGNSSPPPLSKKASQLTTGLVRGTIKGTAKAGYYLVQPRHVEKAEVYGLWRLQLDDGNRINLEVTPRHAILIVDGDDVRKTTFRAPYKFHPARWPVRARIEFSTRQYLYQIILHRKVAARNVLKLKGTIRTRPTTGGFWGGGSGRQRVVHTFVGKRRLRLDVQGEEEDNDVDDDDDDDEEGELDEDGNQVYDAETSGDDDVDDSAENQQDDDSDNAEDERNEGQCEYDDDQEGEEES
jgi:hypothetical protein